MKEDWWIQSSAKENRGRKAIDRFRGELGKANAMFSQICPSPQSMELNLDPCLEVHVGYLTSMGKCKEEDEDECPEVVEYIELNMLFVMDKV